MTTIAQNQQREVKKQYSVEYRVYKDNVWYKGLFSNIKAKWSEWKEFHSFKSFRVASMVMRNLIDNKDNIKHQIEYRIVDNGREE